MEASADKLGDLGAINLSLPISSGAALLPSPVYRPAPIPVYKPTYQPPPPPPVVRRIVPNLPTQTAQPKPLLLTPVADPIIVTTAQPASTSSKLDSLLNFGAGIFNQLINRNNGGIPPASALAPYSQQGFPDPGVAPVPPGRNPGDGAGADAASRAGRAVGGVGDALAQIVQDHPLMVLGGLGAGVLLFMNPPKRRGR